MTSDSKTEGNIKSSQEEKLSKISSSLLGLWSIVCAFLLMFSQLGQALIFIIGIIVTILTIIILHWCDRSRAVKGLGAKMFLGPYAAFFVDFLIHVLIFLNVLWALRWFLTAEFVGRSIYSISEKDYKTLVDCAVSNYTATFAERCQTPAASFFAYPAWVYVHGAGSIACLALGHFQFSKSFRKKYRASHRYLGYIYSVCIIIGTIGSVGLMVVSVSGIFAIIGFIILAITWVFTLIKALYAIKVKRDFQQHRRWMIRNYSYSLGAVWFRMWPFLIYLISGMKMSPGLSYGIGGYFTLLTVYLSPEIYIRKFETYDK